MVAQRALGIEELERGLTRLRHWTRFVRERQFPAALGHAFERRGRLQGLQADEEQRAPVVRPFRVALSGYGARGRFINIAGGDKLRASLGRERRMQPRVLPA